MKVHHAYKILVGEKDLPDNEVSRTARALEGRWPTVAQGVHAFKDTDRCVRNQNLTGNLDEQDLISAATAVICGKGAYAGVSEDRDKDKKNGKSRVRMPKEATCEFVGCWKALRHLDMFRGAAAADATPLPPLPPPSLEAAEESDAEDSDMMVKAPPKTGAYAPAPLGVKAAKRYRSEARSVARGAAMESAKSADALESIARLAAACAQIAVFFSLHMADSAATAVFKKRQTMVLLGKAADKHGDDSASDDESEPYRKKRLSTRAARTPTSTRGVPDISSSSSAAVTPVRVRARCGMKRLTRTSTPTDTRDTAGRRAVDKDPMPVTRLTMDSDSDVQVVQEARIAPRNPTTHHAASAASGGLPLSGSYGITAAALLEQATVNPPMPLPAEPVRLAPLQAPRLAPRPAVFPQALATPPSRNVSLGAKAQRTKEAVSKRAAQPQPSPTIHIDLTASDGGDATDAGKGVAPEATDSAADHKLTDRKTNAATL
ncbi:hypothetical protein I4F81_007771 [Pyropia yezoensis]|uniref:Uncharacterized protein n=1 Tax=Pyropia yezoensis TaxID=2788 RepID=A0ACC3C4Z4_PYRYE|nr:hypothetical protein I4F81_007771 [Neopyropia yezoensis]|eukprot:contig_29804_g7307